MSVQIDLVWQFRWKILDDQLEVLIGRLTQFSQKQDVSILLNMAKCLQSFADNHFNYFLKGFRDELLTPSSKYPVGHVLVVVGDQIAFDLSVLERAIDQRINGSPQMTRALKTADTIAHFALQPAVTAGLIKDTAVITYFQKSYSIRVIPYANVALIGIPFTCVPIYTVNRPDPTIREIVTRDYLAIPHEVGHYVFWHGQINKQYLRTALRQQFPDNEKENRDKKGNYAHWLEETFADIYGCLVAGPVIAKSFQDLQLEYSEEDFKKDDGDHPKPSLRPSIYSLVLSKRKTEFPDFGAKLEKEWVDRVQKRDQTKAQAITQDAAQIIEWKEEQATNETLPMNKIVAKILEQFENVKVEKVAKQNNGWWHDYLSKGNLEIDSLYEEFRTRLLALMESNTPVTSVKVTGIDWETLHTRWSREYKEYQQGSNKVQLPDWFYIFRADGWTTQGPGDNPVGGG